MAMFFAFASCKEWNAAPQTARDTYLTFLDYPQPLSPTAVAPTDDGFVMAAIYSAQGTTTRFIKIDRRGNRIWVRDFLKVRVKTVLSLPDGFILAGDAVHAPGEASKIKMIKTDGEGLIQKQNEFPIRASGETEMDAAVFNETTAENLVVLGRMIKSDADSIFIAKVKTSTLELQWKRQEAALTQGEGLGLDYKNGKSLLRLADKDNKDNIIWAAYAQTYTGDIKNLFGVLPVYRPHLPNATFMNGGKIGNTNVNGANEGYQLKDIASSDLGFGTLGTYTSAGGQKPTGMLFARLRGDGSLERESTLVIGYDPGDNSVKTYNFAERSKVSGTLKGETIASAQDGYVLAGTFYNTSPSRGVENDTDLIIIKLNFLGAVLWHRTFGGKGKEKPARIWTDPDGRITVTGEQDYKNLTVGFVLKVNETGDF